MSDSVKYLRDWAADMRNVSGMSVDADKLDEIATEIEDLKTRLAGCQAARDRLARQLDGYVNAGKKAESWRKKT